jgi:hypothetical protein
VAGNEVPLERQLADAHLEEGDLEWRRLGKSPAEINSTEAEQLSGESMPGSLRAEIERQTLKAFIADEATHSRVGAAFEAATNLSDTPETEADRAAIGVLEIDVLG